MRVSVVWDSVSVCVWQIEGNQTETQETDGAFSYCVSCLIVAVLEKHKTYSANLLLMLSFCCAVGRYLECACIVCIIMSMLKRRLGKLE